MTAHVAPLVPLPANVFPLEVRRVPSAVDAERRDALGVLRLALDVIGSERLALSASFGPEDIVLLDLLTELIPRPRVFTLDTGRLPQETYNLIDAVRARFGVQVEVVFALREAGIPVEVVPGVTSGVAGPAFAGIPVNHRGVARSVAFVTANAAPVGAPDAIDWSGFSSVDTLVVFMAGAAASRTAASLIAAGRSSETAAALIVDATLPEQLVLHTDLATLANGAPLLPSERPCLLVIGEVVGLAGQIGAKLGRPRTQVEAREFEAKLVENPAAVSRGAGSESAGPRRLRSARAVPPEHGTRAGS